EVVLEAPPLPSSSTRLIRGARHTVMGGLHTARAVANLLRKPRRALAEIGAATDAVMELGRIVLGPKPSTPFNGHVGVLRNLTWTGFSLNQVKAIKNRLGGTVNDVILATITAALRAYLVGHGHRPDRMELRAMVPVNVRSPNEHLKLGNRVSMMMAPLPIGILDPVERLHQVRTAMALLKESGQAGRMNRMIELIDVLPPTLQRVVAQLQMAAAPINTICTNVPGPPVSIYVQGKRLGTLVPLVPLAQGVGLAFAILSYADTLTIGITADAASCLVVQTGIGPIRARSAPAAGSSARAYNVFGCPGALARSVARGDLVVADRVDPLDGEGSPLVGLQAETEPLVAWAGAR